MPEIVGAVFVGATATARTSMLKAGSEADRPPSLTLMTMFDVVPTSPEPGVPLSWPVEALKLAQEGVPVIENVSESPFASDAEGWKLYA